MPEATTAILKLIQLSDSAVPIGSAAHSFGFESLVEERGLTVAQLAETLEAYVAEASALEASFCRDAYHLGRNWSPDSWTALNDQIAATKPARESRSASATLGRRLLSLAVAMEGSDILNDALSASKAATGDVHHCAAFGLIGSSLGVPEEFTVSMFVQQTVTAIVSSCQRLMPLGQTDASRLSWTLKERIAAISARSSDRRCFTPMLEIASMRHPHLTTRLFIS